MKKVAIIGAGIAGLAAARALKDHYQIDVFDKSRGVGGRMSTRKADPYQFDHGAQFFTVRHAAFRELITAAEKSDVVSQWRTRTHHLTQQGLKRSANSDNWYVAQPTMTSLCKYLAEDISTRLDCRIIDVEYRDTGWYLTNENHVEYGPYDCLIAAIPHAQFMALFQNYVAEDTLLSQVSMSGCFSLMIGSDALSIPEFNIARVTGSSIGLIVNNASKPTRNHPLSIMVHSTNDWAELHIDIELETVKKRLLAELKRLTGISYDTADYLSLHRWRFAQVEQPLGAPFYQHDNLPLIATGDWCIGPRIECAYLSGLQSAQFILADNFI